MLFESDRKDHMLLRYGMCTKSDDTFNECSPAYLFSNENLKSIFQSIEFRGKDVLTACAGAGDILFNAKLFGANHVDQFDISMFSKYVYEIKYQAFKNLTYAEFLRFFYHKQSFLNKKSGSKIVPNLSTQASYLLESAQNSRYSAEWMFRICGIDKPLANTFPRKSPHIISQKNYDITSERLPLDSKFYLSYLADLPALLTRKYDIIYLSNICQYIRDIRDLDRTVVAPLRPHLNEQGKIVCYQLNGLINKSADDIYGQFGQDNKWKISTVVMKNICSGLGWSRSKNKDTFFVIEKTR